MELQMNSSVPASWFGERRSTDGTWGSFAGDTSGCYGYHWHDDQMFLSFSEDNIFFLFLITDSDIYGLKINSTICMLHSGKPYE